MLNFLKNNFSHWNEGYCSMFFDKVFGVDIGDICYDHDAAYTAATFKLKLIGDWNFAKALWKRAGQQSGWKKGAMRFIGVAMSLAVASFGWLWWLKSVYDVKKEV